MKTLIHQALVLSVSLSVVIYNHANNNVDQNRGLINAIQTIQNTK